MLASMGDRTRDSPWVLRTPSGGSEYQMFRDESLDPPALVCRVGKTELRYHLRCIEDLHAMLKAHGDWMPLGSADEQKPAAEGSVEAWARSPHTPAAASTTSRSLARSSSTVIAFPSTVEAKPHCGERQSWSMSTCRLASSIRRFRSSFRSSSPRLVVTRPSTTIFPGGTNRSGSKPPERSSSYSRKKPSTSSCVKSASATNS